MSSHESGSDQPRSHLRAGLMALGATLGLLLAGYLIHRIFKTYSLEQITEAAKEIPLWRFLTAGAFAAGSYLCLTGFDTLAMRHLGKRTGYAKIAVASFSSLSIGHNIGFAALSSGAIRYRFYSRYGLTVEEIAKLILFCALTVGLGLATLGSLALLLRPSLAEAVTGLDRAVLIWLGAGCALVPVAYFVAATTVRGSLKVFRWTLELPAPKIAAAQIVIGATNFGCVAACLHQALATTGVSYLEVAPAYVIANVATLLSHAPGGLGVIEAVVTHLLPGAKVIGGLVAFRIVYFLVPLALGATLLAVSEFRRRER